MSAYYVAVIDWNQERIEECKSLLAKLADNGSPRVLGLVYYTLGRIAETEKDFSGAGQYYELSLKAGAPSKFRDDILWRMGWVEYRRGNFAQAAENFRQGAARASGKTDDGRFVYWQAKAHMAAGDWEKAAAAESELFQKYPYTYYGLAEKTNALKADPIPNSIIETNATTASLPDPPPGLSAEAGLRLERAMTLIKAGLPRRAERELDLILPEARKEASTLAWLGQMYTLAGAAGRGMSMFGSTPQTNGKSDDFEDAVWRLIYPVNHWDKITAESVKVNIDPMVSLAVIRQESAFDAGIVSPANAIGLMQIVPRTGEQMYNQLKLGRATGAPFSKDLLFSPKVNIAIGVAYLSGLIARYDGSLARALAAYNAGEPAVDQWMKRMADASQEEFIEMIPYFETRDYVKKVLRNLALYRSIYSRVEVTEKPSTSREPAL